MARAASRTGRLIIVSNRLPVSVRHGPSGFTFRPSVGGLATGLSAIHSGLHTLWLGWPGVHADDPRVRKALEKSLLREHQCLPLFIPQRVFLKFYAGFSNGCLWPLFHYFVQYASFDAGQWEAYEQVNRQFCDRIVQIARPGDRFWIHDYHLLLLPGMLRERMPEASIGLFLHIPFPTFEIFRVLPWRQQILRGMLGADLIGFHTFSYARHFFSSLLRIMGIDQEFGRFVVGERPVKADIFPLGVDVDRFAAYHLQPEIQEALEDLRAKAKGRKIMLSVDRLDFTKGIIQRLRAFERFLERQPEWIDKVIMVFLCVPSRTNVPEYASLKRRVDEAVGNINGRFATAGWNPIWYLYRGLPVEELSALYLAADVALVTPLRDGMNLVSKEYLAARPDGTGVLILAETAGSAEELGEALVVNPNDTESMAEAIGRALDMPLEVQRARNQRMMARLRQYNSARWAGDFLDQLDSIVRERPRYQRNWLDETHAGELSGSYARARRRLLLMDYDGTLAPFAERPEDAAPDEEARSIIRELAKDPRNTVVIVSGRDHVTLAKWMEGLGADLVAEHGARWRVGDGEWKLSPDVFQEDWRRSIRPVLEVYVNRTPGAFLEDKGTSLVWHYRTSEPELGALRAMELNGTLQSYVMNTPLHIIQGADNLEVKSGTINKGNAVQRWLRRRPSTDFILAIGDDTTDEDMFRVLPAKAWTIKVGPTASRAARYSVRDFEEVRRLLRRLMEG